MEHNWLELVQGKNQLAKVIETNKSTEQFGLVLTEQDAALIIAQRQEVLKEQRRVEFGDTIVPKLIREFCDSAYINQQNYAQSIIRLQEIFYMYKNEMEDEITDDELLRIMKDQFENLCFGDLDYLAETCLADFAEAIRAGYRGYHNTDAEGEYAKFDKQTRWDFNLFSQALRDIE